MTNPWTELKLPLAIPSEHRDLGNKAAALFDPNTEGSKTLTPMMSGKSTTSPKQLLLHSMRCDQ